MFLNQQHANPRLRFQLAITLNDTGDLIGNCGVRKTAVDALDAELGYEIAPDHWGNGYATEAARAMLGFAFQGLGVHRVAAWDTLVFALLEPEWRTRLSDDPISNA